MLSRRLQTLAALGLLALGAGCTNVYAPTAEPPRLESASVYVATSRLPSPNGGYSGRSSSTLSFAHMDVALPPRREIGEGGPVLTLALPGEKFGISSATPISGAGNFVSQVAANDSVATVYVHGCCSPFEEGLFRIAQLDQDIGFDGTNVLYSWPSSNAFSYLHDQQKLHDAVPGLSRLLIELAASPVKRIQVVSHSMGAYLVMEALADLRRSGHGAALDHIDTVTLLAPDMDAEQFRARARDIGSLHRPIYIYGSQDDWALNFAGDAGIGGGLRLGTQTDARSFAEYNVVILDLAAIDDQSPDGHLASISSPALLGAIARHPGDGYPGFAARAAQGGVPGAIVTRAGKAVSVALPDTLR